MLTTEPRNEFDQCGIVRMPGAVAKPSAEEMLRTIWNRLRDRYQSTAMRRIPGLNQTPKSPKECSRSAEFIGS
jgi:hypothetical protein